MASEIWVTQIITFQYVLPSTMTTSFWGPGLATEFGSTVQQENVGPLVKKLLKIQSWYQNITPSMLVM